MTEKIQHHDFIELDYTGSLPEEVVFDTTVRSVAQQNGIFSDKAAYGPVIICVGEQQILPGLDAQLVGKEIGREYTIVLAPEAAFGKREVKKMKIVPSSTFQEHKVQPHPGLQIDMDGERGIVTRVAGGRVMVNFNHPLAGKEVQYTFTIHRKIIQKQEQIAAFLNTTLLIPARKMSVKIDQEKAGVELPMDLPPQFTDVLGKKLAELTGLKEITFSKAEQQ